jgi:hypothetical protein
LFLVILLFELRVFHILGKYSTTWAMPPKITLFYQAGSHISLGWPWTTVLLSMPPGYLGLQACAIMPGLFSWDGVSWTFA